MGAGFSSPHEGYDWSAKELSKYEKYSKVNENSEVVKWWFKKHMELWKRKNYPKAPMIIVLDCQTVAYLILNDDGGAITEYPPSEPPLRSIRRAILTRGTICLIMTKKLNVFETTCTQAPNQLSKQNVIIPFHDLARIAFNIELGLVELYCKSTVGSGSGGSNARNDVPSYIYQIPPEDPPESFLQSFVVATISSYSGFPLWAIPIQYSLRYAQLASAEESSKLKIQKPNPTDGGLSRALISILESECIKSYPILRIMLPDTHDDMLHHVMNAANGDLRGNPLDLAALIESTMIKPKKDSSRETAIHEHIRNNLIVSTLSACLPFNLVVRKLKLSNIKPSSSFLDPANDEEKRIDATKQKISQLASGLAMLLQFNVTLIEIDLSGTKLTGFGSMLGRALATNVQPLLSKLNVMDCGWTQNDVQGLVQPGLQRLWCGGSALPESILIGAQSDQKSDSLKWDILYETLLDPPSAASTIFNSVNVSGRSASSPPPINPEFMALSLPNDYDMKPPPPSLAFLQVLDVRGTVITSTSRLSEIISKSSIRHFAISGSGVGGSSLSTFDDTGIMRIFQSLTEVKTSHLVSFHGVNLQSEFESSLDGVTVASALHAHQATLRKVTLENFSGNIAPLLSSWPMSSTSIRKGLDSDPTLEFVGKTDHMTASVSPSFRKSNPMYAPGSLVFHNIRRELALEIIDVLKRTTCSGLKSLAIKSDHISYIDINPVIPNLLGSAEAGEVEGDLESLDLQLKIAPSTSMRSSPFSEEQFFWERLAPTKKLVRLLIPNQLSDEFYDGSNPSSDGATNTVINCGGLSLLGAFLKTNRSVRAIDFDSDHLYLHIDGVKALRSAFYGNKKVVSLSYPQKAYQNHMAKLNSLTKQCLKEVNDNKYEIKKLFKRHYSKHRRNWRERPNELKKPFVENIRQAKRKMGLIKRNANKISTLLQEIQHCVKANSLAFEAVRQEKGQIKLSKRQHQLEGLAQKKVRIVTKLVTKMHKAKVKSRKGKSAKTQVGRDHYYKDKRLWIMKPPIPTQPTSFGNTVTSNPPTATSNPPTTTSNAMKPSIPTQPTSFGNTATSNASTATSNPPTTTSNATKPSIPIQPTSFGNTVTGNAPTAISNAPITTSNATTATNNPSTAANNTATATSNAATASGNSSSATSNAATATGNPSTATSNAATATGNLSTATSNATTVTTHSTNTNSHWHRINDPYHMRYPYFVYPYYGWGYSPWYHHNHYHYGNYYGNSQQSSYPIEEGEVEDAGEGDGEEASDNDDLDQIVDFEATDEDLAAAGGVDPWNGMDELTSELQANPDLLFNEEFMEQIHNEASELGPDVLSELSPVLDDAAEVTTNVDSIAQSIDVDPDILNDEIGTYNEDFNLEEVIGGLGEVPEYEVPEQELENEDDVIDLYAGAGPRDLDDGGPFFGNGLNAALAGARRKARTRKIYRTSRRVRDKIHGRLDNSVVSPLIKGYSNLRFTAAALKTDELSSNLTSCSSFNVNWPEDIVTTWEKEVNEIQIEAMSQEEDLFTFPTIARVERVVDWSLSYNDVTMKQRKDFSRNPLTSNANSIVVVLVTQCSLDRLPNLEAQLASWGGMASVAIHLKEGDDLEESKRLIFDCIDAAQKKAEEVRMKVGHDFQLSASPKSTWDVAVTICQSLSDDETKGVKYPINFLRNVALLQAKERQDKMNVLHDLGAVLLVDVDFCLSQNLYHVLHSSAAMTRVCYERNIMVCPAFECSGNASSTNHHMLDATPNKMEELLQCIDNGTVEGFHQSQFPQGHGPTDFQRYLAISRLLLSNASPLSGQKADYDRLIKNAYPVSYASCFEPYVVMKTEDVPLYDERFQGYGLNKISHFVSIARSDGCSEKTVPKQFHVIPGVFIVAPVHHRSESWKEMYGGEEKDSFETNFNQLWLKGLYRNFKRRVLEEGKNPMISPWTESWMKDHNLATHASSLMKRGKRSGYDDVTYGYVADDDNVKTFHDSNLINCKTSKNRNDMKWKKQSDGAETKENKKNATIVTVAKEIFADSPSTLVTDLIFDQICFTQCG